MSIPSIADKQQRGTGKYKDTNSITVANSLIYATGGIRGNLERKCFWALLKRSPWLDAQGLPSHVEIKVKDLYRIIHPGKYAGGYFNKKLKCIVEFFNTYEVFLRISTTNNKLLKVLDDHSVIRDEKNGRKLPFYVDKVHLFEYIYIDNGTLSYSVNPLVLTLVGKDEMPYTTIPLDIIYAAKKSKLTVRAFEYIQIHVQYKQKDKSVEYSHGISNFLFIYSSVHRNPHRDEYPIREFFGIPDGAYSHPSLLIKNLNNAFAEVCDLIPSLTFDYEAQYKGKHFNGILIKTLTFDNVDTDEKDVALPF